MPEYTPETPLPQAFCQALITAFGQGVRFSEPLSGHTTSRLGGPADAWLLADSLEVLMSGATLAHQFEIPVFILGGGANLLIGDGGIRGLVIENRANKIVFPAGGLAAPKLIVESGVILPNLVRRCAKRGFSGLEWAVGVPGTVGGAIVNNAGAYGGSMATRLIRAELLSPQRERIWQPVEWFKYGYRTSRLKQDRQREWLVLQAELQLTRASATEVEATVHALNERRKSSQPPGATMGSMFKNPPDDYAGRLIEAVGLKGYRYGQAQISSIHANFFQNLGNATAAEMLHLIQTARDAVEAKFGVKLALEIEVVGEFDTTAR